MVISLNKRFRRDRRARQAALLMTELMIGIAIVGIAVFPLAYSFAKEHQYLRACYQRAVAMEMVDGEMEVLLAGEGHGYTDGVHTLTPRAQSAVNLPPGILQLTVTGKTLRLEWLPSMQDQGGKVVREATAR
jgi:hypothetical protein